MKLLVPYLVILLMCFFTSGFGQSLSKPIHWELKNIISTKDQIPEANSAAIKIGPWGLLYVAGQGNLCVLAQKERIALIPWIEITNGSQNAFDEDIVLCPLRDFTLAADKEGLGWVNGKNFQRDHIRNNDNSPVKIVSHMVSINGYEAFILVKDSTLYRYNSSGLKPTKLNRLIAITGSGKSIFCATKKAFYHLKEDGIIQSLLWKPEPEGQEITNLFMADERRTAIYTSDHKLIIYSDKKEEQIQLDTTWVIRDAKYLNGDLFIATLDDGLFIYTSAKVWKEVSLKTESGKPLKYILSLEVTKDNVLFIGTRGGGVLSFSPQRSSVFVPFLTELDAVKEFHDFSIRSIFKPPDESFAYFGTDEGQVYRYDHAQNKTYTVLTLPTQANRMQIRSLSATKDRIYIGTGVSKGYLYEYARNRNSTWKRINTHTFNNKVKSVTSLLLIGDYLLIGTSKGLYSLNTKSGKGVMDTIIKGDIAIRNLVNLNDQIFAVGNKGGLWKISNESDKSLKINTFTYKRLISPNSTDKDFLYIDSCGKREYYLFVRGSFIQKIRIDGDFVQVIATYNEKNGLVGADAASADVVYGGFVDEHKNLWGLTDKGVFCKQENDNFFYRFSPEVMGLPDNPDGNTGAFCKWNKHDWLIGFRSGGVLVHTNKFEGIASNNIVLERLEDGEDENYEIKENIDTIRRDKNFSSINLIPFDLEHVFGGAKPIKITTDSTVNHQSGNMYRIIPAFFNSIKSQSIGDIIRIKIAENTDLIIKFRDYPVFLAGAIFLSIALLIGGSIIFLYINNEKKRRIKIIIVEAEKEKARADAEKEKSKAQAETKKSRAAQAEAEKAQVQAEIAKVERDKLNSMVHLSTKALGEHFMRNNLNEIIITKELQNESKNLNLFKSIIQLEEIKNTGISNNLLNWLEIESRDNPEIFEYLPSEIAKELNEKGDRSISTQILKFYASHLNGLMRDEEKAWEVRDKVFAYYTKLINENPQYTIQDDAELIRGMCRLYQLNPNYVFDYKDSSDFFKSGEGAIAIICENENFKQAIIPRMLIQPLVENARKYGEKPFSILVEYRQIRKDGMDWAEFSVTNPGKWKEQKPDKVKQKHSLDIIENLVVRYHHGEWDGRKEFQNAGSHFVNFTFSFPIQLQSNNK